MRKLRFLCICQYGHSRSVALARVLHGMGYEAIPIGYGTSPSSIDPLGEWADMILIVDRGAWFLVNSATQLKNKSHDFDVGPDRWVNPYHPELQTIFEAMVKERLFN
jgi:hypothetical protein